MDAAKHLFFKKFTPLKIKFFIKTLTYITLFFLVERFCYFQTEGFRIRKVNSSFPSNWVSSPVDPAKLNRINQLLDQPFYFLASGVQCYAFISKDKKTILKLFKHHHLGPSTQWLYNLPTFSFLTSIKENIIAKREKRMRAIFKSCQIAYDHLQEETGLFYIHLNTTQKSHGILTIFDKIGVKHTLDLDTFHFVLQNCAELASDRLSTLFSNGDLEGAKICLRALMLLMQSYVDKGIKSKDSKIDKNFGFIKDHAIQIDIGSLTRRTQKSNQHIKIKELTKMARRLKFWIAHHFPKYLNACDQEMQNIINENSL